MKTPDEEMPLENLDDQWLDLMMNMAVVVTKKGIKNDLAGAMLDYIQWKKEKHLGNEQGVPHHDSAMACLYK